MKHFLALFLMFLVASCGGGKENTETSQDNNSSKTDQDTTEVEKKYEWNYYAGKVGQYYDEVVMQLAYDEGEVIGGYWYLKHGKKLTLNGTVAPKTGEITMEESYNGKTTGKFVLQKKGDMLTGSWYAPNSKEPQEVELELVIKDKEEELELSFEKYQFKHTIWILGFDDEDEEEEAIDEFMGVRIGDEQLLFSYEVTGSNAHMGFISGLARFTSKNKAVFKGEDDCELTIEFTDANTVSIQEDNCSYYRGMRAYFDGDLKKVR